MEEKVNTTETHWIIQKRSLLLHNNAKQMKVITAHQ